MPRSVLAAGGVRRLPRLTGAERHRALKTVRKDRGPGPMFRLVVAEQGRSACGARSLLLEAGAGLRPNPNRQGSHNG